MTTDMAFQTQQKQAVRSTVHFSGQVQGVGFRYTTQNIALQHDVVGYVKNLNDGRVELVMEGPADEAQAVVESLKDRMADFVDDAEVERSAPTGEFARFCIRH